MQHLARRCLLLACLLIPLARDGPRRYLRQPHKEGHLFDVDLLPFVGQSAEPLEELELQCELQRIGAGDARLSLMQSLVSGLEVAGEDQESDPIGVEQVGELEQDVDFGCVVLVQHVVYGRDRYAGAPRRRVLGQVMRLELSLEPGSQGRQGRLL